MTGGGEVIQRLDDLIEITENKEVKLLAKILRDHFKKEVKSGIGFKHNKEEK